MRSYGPNGGCGVVETERKGLHNRPLGIFHSQSRSSEDLHPSWTSGWIAKVNGAETKGMRDNEPEKDIASIPEDNWKADCGPDGNPGVCLGIAHHFVDVLARAQRTAFIRMAVAGSNVYQVAWNPRRWEIPLRPLANRQPYIGNLQAWQLSV